MHFCPEKRVARGLRMWPRAKPAAAPRMPLLQMCIVHFKERERIAPGARMDDRVLFIEEVTYESVREMFSAVLGRHGIPCASVNNGLPSPRVLMQWCDPLKFRAAALTSRRLFGAGGYYPGHFICCICRRSLLTISPACCSTSRCNPSVRAMHLNAPEVSSLGNGYEPQTVVCLRLPRLLAVCHVLMLRTHN